MALQSLVKKATDAGRGVKGSEIDTWRQPPVLIRKFPLQWTHHATAYSFPEVLARLDHLFYNKEHTCFCVWLLVITNVFVCSGMGVVPITELFQGLRSSKASTGAYRCWIEIRETLYNYTLCCCLGKSSGYNEEYCVRKKATGNLHTGNKVM